MMELSSKTLSQIVTENYQAARVFEKYGLDFCCKGKRPLETACKEKNIAVNEVLNELQSIQGPDNGTTDFNKMSLSELAGYIERVHHTYVRESMPETLSYLERVATKHGDHYPYMKEVLYLFSELHEEMKQHMMKEEKVLFPRIKLLELNAAPENPQGYVAGPISVMEHEHDNAGNIMESIRNLTRDYTAPEQACTTFRLSLAALKAFEADLHRHVHLENNILFPKAISLQQKLQPSQPV